MQVSCVSPHQLTGRVCGTRTQWVSEAWCVIRMGERDFAPRWRWTWAERPASRTCARWLSRNGRFCSESFGRSSFRWKKRHICVLSSSRKRTPVKFVEFWEISGFRDGFFSRSSSPTGLPITRVPSTVPGGRTAYCRAWEECQIILRKKSVKNLAMKVWMIRNQSLLRDCSVLKCDVCEGRMSF